MAGTLKTSQFNSATVANPTDEVPLLQGGQLKRVQVKVLTGNPDVGWQSTGESWVFSSFNSTTRIGVVTVPSDATTKYNAGMRVRINQATGGVKYAIIHLVTTTTLSLFMQSGVTLNNEAINTPFYSPLDTPVGFPRSEDNWKLRVFDATTRQSNTPTQSTWYVPAGSTLNQLVGAGKYIARYNTSARVAGTGSMWCIQQVTLSTTTNSETDTDLTTYSGYDAPTSGAIVTSPTHMTQKLITVASNTTYTLLHWVSSSNTIGGSCGFYQKSWIEFVSAYL